MSTIISKNLPLSKAFYTILAVLLHITLSNCGNISKSHIGDPNLTSHSGISNEPHYSASSIITGGKTDALKSEKMLICFDCDQTIVHEHANNELTCRGLFPKTKNNSLWSMCKDEIDARGPACENYDGQYTALLTSSLFYKKILTVRNPNKLKDVINKLLEQGHKIAIVTFSGYPDSILVILEKVGLSEEQIKNIPIIGGFPKGGVSDPNCKMEHIEKAKELTGIRDNKDVILVDDSEANINAAQQNGATGILVGKDFSWSQILKKVDQLT